MRFVMINLILVCLLLFGIGYLAFGNVETDPNPERSRIHSLCRCSLFGQNFVERSGNSTKPSGDRGFNFREFVVCLPT